MTLAFSTRYSYLKATQKNGSVLPVVKISKPTIRTMLNSTKYFKLPNTDLVQIRNISQLRGGYYKGNDPILKKQINKHPSVFFVNCRCQGICICTPSNLKRDVKLIGTLTHGDEYTKFVKKHKYTVFANPDGTYIYFFNQMYSIRPVDAIFLQKLDQQVFTQYKHILKIQSSSENKKVTNLKQIERIHIPESKKQLYRSLNGIFNPIIKKNLPITSDIPENSRKKSVKNKPDIRPKKENTVKQHNNHPNKTNIEKDKTFTSDLHENDFN